MSNFVIIPAVGLDRGIFRGETVCVAFAQGEGHGLDIVADDVQMEVENWAGTSSRADMARLLTEVYRLPGAAAPGRKFSGAKWRWE